MAEEGTEISVASAYCVVYRLEKQEWRVGGEGWSQVQLYRDKKDDTYRLVGWTLQDYNVVVNANVTAFCKYKKKTTDFHKFTDEDDNVYGFGFYKKEESIEESERLMAAVINIIEQLRANLPPSLQQQLVSKMEGKNKKRQSVSAAASSSSSYSSASSSSSSSASASSSSYASVVKNALAHEKKSPSSSKSPSTTTSNHNNSNATNTRSASQSVSIPRPNRPPPPIPEKSRVSIAADRLKRYGTGLDSLNKAQKSTPPRVSLKSVSSRPASQSVCVASVQKDKEKK
eukprot:TRINITY_DN970_c1_g1_i1.p1 TRINITY_DN970_c1_g1~~TRINITY_DN970_c1_g1_i1.p1  ORF type:complete len:286 (+),score=91.35 TRINITY_DN970_c1_g1_i1:94-951(+)